MASVLPPSIPPVVGGRYRIEGQLGRGGVGRVFRAHDTARDRVVALKRLELRDVLKHDGREPAQGSDLSRRQSQRRAQLVTLFQREYHTLAQLAHPRIIEVYDYGIDEHGPYYTMELLEGHDLAKAAPLPWPRACEVLRDVASALTLLHSRRLLHRDISPRNVYCGAHGHAKLIDFGAMAYVGLPEVLAGTPTFVAPEAVQRQSLDARSDLYSLGALGYFLLTGRPPYPATSFAALRDAYRTYPGAPSAYAPDVPAQLDALVMQLLSLDRGVRPSSAVELVERLTALAGLEHDPRLAVASAYLTTPALVGRDKELIAVRRRTLRAMRGRGASLLVSGARGVGRSRFLDACALEGKLAGALVLRGGAGAAGGADHGVMRSLLLQLHGALGDAERRAFEPEAALRAQLVPGLLWTRANGKPVSARPVAAVDDPGAIPSALHAYLTKLAGQRLLMLLIDDFDAIDEPSAALIAGLSRIAAASRLVIVATCGNDAPPSPGLRLLQEYSRTLPLAALGAHETEALLRSVFGAVPNLAPLANRLHALSAGRPQLCMELAQHLVDRGVIRYETGGFALPEALAPGDLPESLDAALRARCERLSAHARALGAVVALCAGAPLTVEQCLQLAQRGGGRGEDERALGELIASQLVIVEDEHIALRQNAFAEALLAEFGPDARQALHARIAEQLAVDPALCVRAAEHYFDAGMPGAGLDLLLAHNNTGRLVYEWFPTYHALITRALAACAELQRPARDAFMIERARNYHNIHYLEPCDSEQLLEFAMRLYRMTGLDRWHALHDEPDPQQRLTKALTQCAEAYQQTPERERIYAPQEAIEEVARYLAMLAGHGVSTFDLDLLERLPTLAPYVALSPAIGVMEEIICGLRDLRALRHDGYVSAMHRVLARLEQPDRAGLPPREHQTALLSITYTTALTCAAIGDAKAFELADRLEAMPSFRINAWRVRQIAHLYRGDAQQAEQCRRQVELLLIQQGTSQALRGTTLETEFMCYAASDDLLNLRRVLPELDGLAQRHPGWRPMFLVAQAELERIRGRLEAACALYKQVLEMVPMGRHMVWPHAVGFYVNALVELGRADEARAYATLAAAYSDTHQMGLQGYNVSSALAYAESACGDLPAAIARTDAVIAEFERAGVQGMYAGMRYELRARLALQARDLQGFAEYFQRCRAHYGGVLDSPFTARVARLIADARRADLHVDAAELAEQALLQALVQRMRRELGLCADPEERAERALLLLVEATSARAGQLYGWHGGELKLLATTAGAAPSDRMRSSLLSFIGEYNQADQELTEVVGSDIALVNGGNTTLITDADGATYHPFPIAADRVAEPLAAVVALAFPTGAYRAPARELLATVAEELLARGDVTAMTLLR